MKQQSKRIQRKTGKLRQSARSAKNKFVPPRTLDEFFAMPELIQDQWNRAVHAVSKMRTDGTTLPQASREFGLNPRVIARLGRPALRKRSNGRYAAKATDQLFRPLLVLTPEGPREIGVRDSRQATLVAKHWNAAHRYLETGDDSVRRKFRGKRITDANGRQVRLLTDLNQLDRLGSAGVLSFESLYARTA